MDLSVITAVDENSPLRGRVHPGDTLLSINGHDVEDVLDYRYYSYDARLTLRIRVSDGRERTLRIRKEEGEDLGLEFADTLMDEARSCRNHCVFCFVDQLPRGLRRTLYFKDDDARLSFLTGSYITLTNLSEREIDRLCALRVSPIRVSVHATDPELRMKLLGNPKAAPILPLLQRLADAEIEMECQIVCCPGLNDGAALRQTMKDLAALYPAVNSVSVVPVGLTKHRKNLYPLTPFDTDRARKTIADVEKFASECLEKYGSRIFFCADELYLKAGLTLPEELYYEGYPQLENGVGLLRLLREEFLFALDDVTGEAGDGAAFSIATGCAAAETLRELLEKAKEKCPRIEGRVYAIVNDFFGHSVDVAGLVTGGDLIAQLRGKELGTRLLIPQTMLRHGEGVFLDDVTLEDVRDALGVPVIPVAQDGGELLAAMLNSPQTNGN
ncbi:MAG: DUF512 domain-containing protein [Eubacteriales bacterium]|nr:DUF512 domain-containing protein [Eubacteriales bacterium]